MKGIFAKIDTAFRNSKHPNNLLSDDAIMSEIKSLYESIFASKMRIESCGVCLYEKYREMKDLSEKQLIERLNLPVIIKENAVVWYKSRPYSRKSPHLTHEIMGEIAQIYPEKVEENKYFRQTEKQAAEPVKRRKTKKKPADGNDNQG